MTWGSKRRPHSSGDNTSSLADSHYYLRGFPSQYQVDAANEFRRVIAAMTPATKAAKAWKHSGKLRGRRRPVTLPTKPFDHRGGE